MAGAAGVAALSFGPDPLGAKQLPGQPGEQIGAGPHEKRQRAAPSVMAIAAHPGDAFFAMGAPVALAAHQGGEGFFLSLSHGEKGSTTIPPAQYGAMQEAAGSQAAAQLGAKYLSLPYGDGEIPNNDEIAFAVCDLIRQYRPRTVVTHWKGSWHKDHIACHEIVQVAIFYAALPTIVRPRAAHSVGSLYFADNWEDAGGFVPDIYLDITSVCDSWLRACNVFPMWRGENGFRYNDYYSSRAIGCGCLNGSTQAVSLMSSEDQRVQHVRSL